MGDFIAQIGNLGDSLDYWAREFVNKNAIKTQILVVGDFFSLTYVVKYVRSWAIFDLRFGSPGPGNPIGRESRKKGERADSAEISTIIEERGREKRESRQE